MLVSPVWGGIVEARGVSPGNQVLNTIESPGRGDTSYRWEVSLAFSLTPPLALRFVRSALRAAFGSDLRPSTAYGSPAGEGVVGCADM